MILFAPGLSNLATDASQHNPSTSSGRARDSIDAGNGNLLSGHQLFLVPRSCCR